jgi:hypothetical protein
VALWWKISTTFRSTMPSSKPEARKYLLQSFTEPLLKKKKKITLRTQLMHPDT